MNKNSMKQVTEKAKSFISDSFLSILGLMLMNVALQVLLFPFLERELGETEFGSCLHLISYINIVAVAVGCGTSHARMVESITENTSNGDYHLWLLAVSGLITLTCFTMWFAGGLVLSFAELVCYILLFCATMWRYYADVEFRLSVNYKKCFLYYLLVGVGYVVGMGLYRLIPLWPLPSLIGECIGLAYVFLRGHVLRKNVLRRSSKLGHIWKNILILIPALILSNLIFNADRLILNFFTTSAMVTIYYIASLLGKTMSMISTPLNGVIIGYLSRYKGAITKKMMMTLILCVLALTLVVAGAVNLASHIFIPFLYPDLYDTVKLYFWQANLAQVFYFSSGILTVVLLRIADQRYQLFINIIYLVVFLLLCIPGTIYMGLQGFNMTFMLVNIIRFATAAVMALHSSGKSADI